MSLPLSDDLAAVPAIISFFFISKYLCYVQQWLTIPFLVGNILVHNGHLNSGVAVASVDVATDIVVLCSLMGVSDVLAGAEASTET